jgi:hypothetical protein
MRPYLEPTPNDILNQRVIPAGWRLLRRRDEDKLTIRSLAFVCSELVLTKGLLLTVEYALEDHSDAGDRSALMIHVSVCSHEPEGMTQPSDEEMKFALCAFGALGWTERNDGSIGRARHVWAPVKKGGE